MSTNHSSIAPFDPPRRTLLGPGPSDVAPSVLAALGRPTIGHLDPRFLVLMDEISSMLRAVFGTDNALTLPMSGTGSAGMEASIVNLVEPGDHVLVGVHGVFGGRLAEVARRAGGVVEVVESPWGEPLDADRVREAALRHRPSALVLVHAETSTGVLTPLAPFRAIADELGALLVVDMVTSLGGLAVDLDANRVDAAYSGTQKCLSCPPGLAPISLSARAVERLERRRAPVSSWYLDLSLIRGYWGTERVYHHTAPINMLYALHEALRLVVTEGLEARIERHQRVARALWAGLEALGLELLVTPEARLSPLTTVKVPASVDEAQVRRAMLSDFGVEIGGGLGPLEGRVWRIGLMGHGANWGNVALCLAALEAALGAQGRAPGGADAIAKARAVMTA